LRHPFVIVCMLVAAAGCSQSAVQTLPGMGGASQAMRPARAGAASAPGVVVWYQSDGFKVRPNDPPQPKNAAVTASGARGESVSFQIVVSATKGALSKVDVAVSDLSDGHGHTIAAASSIELFREFYLDLTQPSGATGHTGEYPDGLVPMGLDPYYHEQRNGAPFSVATGKNQAVWVDVNVAANAAPGVYHGTAAVSSAGKPIGQLPVTFTVWNFALPATASLTTAFGFNTYQAYQGHYKTWNTQRIVTLSNLYQTEALKNRISLYENDVEGPQYTYNAQTHKVTNVDYTLFDTTMVPVLDGSLAKNHAEATIAQMPDANVLPGATPGPNDDQAKAFWQVVSGHFGSEGWMAKNFYYDVDEPQTAEDFATAEHRADLVHAANPGLKVMETTTIHAGLIGKIDIWDPIVNELDSPGFPSPSAYAARQKLGEKVWFYHSNSSLGSYGPWPNFFVDRGMNDTRIFAWMAWRYQLNGFLYYSTTLNYNRVPNPWTNVYFFGDNGDGTLFYPGRTDLIGGKHDIPCDSIRLKTIRAAMQDYEYMVILHNKGQDAFLNALVKKLVVKTNNWTSDPNAIEAARAQMAAKIVGN
jgi:Domain of unknown function (DUF4091)